MSSSQERLGIHRTFSVSLTADGQRVVIASGMRDEVYNLAGLQELLSNLLQLQQNNPGNELNNRHINAVRQGIALLGQQ